MKFNVEIARLFTDGTWDSVWYEVSAKTEDIAKEKAEQQALNDFVMSDSSCELSHVTAVCIQEG
jgi:hypothetical protein